MFNVFLIRHGESQANAGLATYEPKNVAITPLGHVQARCITNYLENYPLDMIVTSPYLRAKQTAAPSMDSLLFHSIPKEEWQVQEFTYLASMHQQHLTLQQRRPRVEAYWEACRPLWVDGPSSESFAQFIQRVRAFITQLQNTGYENIAVFSHEQFINAVLWLAENNAVTLSPAAMRAFRDFLKSNVLPNGAIVKMKVHHQLVAGSFERITEHLTLAGAH